MVSKFLKVLKAWAKLSIFSSESCTLLFRNKDFKKNSVITRTAQAKYFLRKQTS